MATFDELRKRTKQMAERISSATDLPEQVVLNVIMYTKTLTHPDRHDAIDKTVFTAQLCIRFGMTSKLLVDLIFESIKIRGSKWVRIEEFARMVCIFYSKNLDLKIDFVFRVYDLQRNNSLNVKDVSSLLLQSVVFPAEDTENDETVKDLVDLVLHTLDKESTGQITLESFRYSVKHDVLCIQLLGPALPLEDIIYAFFQIMQSRAPHEISNLFANERKRCLQEPILPIRREKIYPIKLEIP